MLTRTTPQAKALATWSAHVQTLLPLRRALQHWSATQLAAALRSWEQLAQEAATSRRVLACFCSSASKKALAKWGAHACEARAQQERTHAMLRRFSPAGRAKTKVRAVRLARPHSRLIRPPCPLIWSGLSPMSPSAA